MLHSPVLSLADQLNSLLLKPQQTEMKGHVYVLVAMGVWRLSELERENTNQ
jgi:hypothetical protein